MRTRPGEEGLVDDGWIGSSQLDMTEPEQANTRCLRPVPLVHNSKRSANELHCAAPHCTASRCDAAR